MITIHRLIVAVAFVAFAPLAAHAQPQPADQALSPLQVAVACAIPPETLVSGSATLHVIGSQDPAARSDFSNHDMLVLDAGSSKGIEVGQRYFTRRPLITRYTGVQGVAHTSGWIRVVAVNENRAIAAVDQACSDIRPGDVLEPFVVPVLPADVSAVDRSVEPDFKSMGRVVFGDQEHNSVGAGDFVLIDRGTDQGLATGSRFAIYRNVRPWKGDYGGSTTQLPLTAIGEGVVVATGPTMATLQILAARDAVFGGDFVVPRKK